MVWLQKHLDGISPQLTSFSHIAPIWTHCLVFSDLPSLLSCNFPCSFCVGSPVFLYFISLSFGWLPEKRYVREKNVEIWLSATAQNFNRGIIFPQFFFPKFLKTMFHCVCVVLVLVSSEPLWSFVFLLHFFGLSGSLLNLFVLGILKFYGGMPYCGSISIHIA